VETLEHCEDDGLSEMDDVVTPNWRKLQAAGVIVNNYMQQRITESSDGAFLFDKSMAFTAYGSSGKRHWWHYQNAKTIHDGETMSLLPVPTTIDVETLRDLALTRVWANVAAAPWQALVTVAEAHKTVELVKDLILQVIRIIRWVKGARRKIKIGAWTAFQAAQAWMVFRYGIRPTIYEILQSIEAVRSMSEKPRVRFTAYAEDEASAEDSQVKTYYPGETIERSITFSRTSKRRYTVRAGVLVVPVLKSSNPIVAFGLDEFFGTAWELIPLSFVLDWIFNIQDFVSSWTPQVEVRPLCSWTTTHDTASQSNSVTSLELVNNRWDNPDAGSYYYDPGNPGHTWFLRDSYPHYLKTMVKTRTPDPNRPMIPSLNVRLNVMKVIDLCVIAKKLILALH
jgi:hypothetical protein